MNTFQIQLHSHEIDVSRQDENVFIVHLPEKTIHLLRIQDNEGANHWFEEGKDNETAQTSELGDAIESWLSEHHMEA